MKRGTNNKTKLPFPIKNPMLAIIVNNSFSELENSCIYFYGVNIGEARASLHTLSK